MRPATCAHEQEVARAVLSRRFEVSDELRSHAETCELCAEVTVLAGALRDDRDDTLRDVHVPAAGQVWWRSALRAHAEATAAARRPIVWLQGIAGACGVGIGAALLGVAWPSIYDAAVGVAALPATFGPDMAPLVDALRPAVPLALAIIACLVLTPIVVYLALSDD
jgi:hypothetical protein